MKTRLLMIIGMIVFPLVIQQGFSQCIYNDDWPDAPCFDLGPVSHMEFNKAWAPYYDHKGAEWMETKRIELNQVLEQKITKEWVKVLENHNVYQYYLSRNEIQSQLPYDGLFVTLDPNFVTEPNCGSNTRLTDGICIVIDGGCEPDINGNTTWCGPQYDYLKIILSESYAFLFVFGTPSLIAGIIIGVVVIWRKRK